MRNVFDQYKHHENRLTHALLSSLEHDRQLLQRFLRRFAKETNLDLRSIKIIEQQMPYATEPQANTERSNSLPDGVIYDGKESALIVESKIAAPVRPDQLERHYVGLVRRGFSQIKGLIITADAKTSLRAPWVDVSWSEIYGWLCEQTRHSIWQEELKHFLEITEAQMVKVDALGDQTLTRFNGIPFGRADDPYTYPEAKRLLRLLRAKILTDTNSCDMLGLNRAAPGRPRITNDPNLWDFFQLLGRPQAKYFTSFPYLTFVIGPTVAAAYVTVFPNAVVRDIRHALAEASHENFRDAISQFLLDVESQFQKREGVRPIIGLSQRRFRARSSSPTDDVTLHVDLRTADKREQRTRNEPKYVPEWSDMAHDLIGKKGPNLLFEIGCEFDYSTCDEVHRPSADQLFVKGWQASCSFFNALKVRLRNS